MAILKLEEMRKMTREQRNKELSELKAELSSLMSKVSIGGSLENPARIGLIKKTIAQFYTINREEELGIRKAATKEEKGKGKSKEKEKEKEKEKAQGKELAAPKKGEKKPKGKKEKEEEDAEKTSEEETDE